MPEFSNVDLTISTQNEARKAEIKFFAIQRRICVLRRQNTWMNRLPDVRSEKRFACRRKACRASSTRLARC